MAPSMRYFKNLRRDDDKILSEKEFKEIYLESEHDLLGEIFVNREFHKIDKKTSARKYVKNNIISYLPGVRAPELGSSEGSEAKSVRVQHHLTLNILSYLLNKVPKTKAEKEFQELHSVDNIVLELKVPKATVGYRTRGENDKGDKVPKKKKYDQSFTYASSMKRQEQKLRAKDRQPHKEKKSGESKRQRRNVHRFPMSRKIQKVVESYNFNPCNWNILFPPSITNILTNERSKLYISLQDTVLFKRILNYPGTASRSYSNKQRNLHLSKILADFLKADHIHEIPDSWESHDTLCSIDKEVICAIPERGTIDFLNNTNILILLMIKDRLLDKINYVIEDTKQYVLLNATLDERYKKGDRNKECILKIFKTNVSNENLSTFTLRMLRKWAAETEMQILQRLNKYDMNVPQFIVWHEHIVVMAFPGDNNISGRTLDKLCLEPETWLDVYEKVVELLRKLYENAVLFKLFKLQNILWYEGKCWLINISDAEGLLDKKQIGYLDIALKQVTKFFKTKIPSDQFKEIQISEITIDSCCKKVNYFRGTVCTVHDENCNEIIIYKGIKNIMNSEEISYMKQVFMPRVYNMLQIGVASSEIIDYVRKTNMILRKVLKSDTLRSIDYKMMLGRKYNMLNASIDKRTKCVIKIYNFSENYKLNQDLRRLGENEEHNLFLMQKNGMKVPKFIERHEHILLLSFPGTNNINGRLLVDLRLEANDWTVIYKKVTRLVYELYQNARLVHGNLSEHTIMWYMNKCWIINTAECKPANNFWALDYIKKDCKTITSFFNKLDVRVMMTQKQFYCYVTKMFC